MHKLEDFESRTKVAYIPSHLQTSDLMEKVKQSKFISKIHPDIEWGEVSSRNDKCVFVKFYPQLSRFGWNGTTSQGCRPEDLVIVR